MGVTGLWRLIEPTGKPVPVETLENKVLAVDISIWLHQMVKGYQDAKGAPMPNAHLMGLFQRLCKLLYFRIKPVFIFDGAFPELKKETIAKRQDSKSRYNSESERLKRELAILLGKKTAITSILGKQISPKKGKDPSHENDDDLFKLPSMPQVDEQDSESDEDESNSSGSITDLHSVDLESDKFKNLNTKEKYDLLIELKETRKMNSWGKLHELPKKSDNFSDFQMQRLLKRRKVQECLAETEKEMGSSGMSLNELESLLNEEGIDTKIESLPTRRIASDETTRFILINNVKQALADAKKRKMENENNGTQQTVETKPDEKNNQSQNDELEEDLQKAIQMSLECVDEPNTSTNTINKTEDSWTSNLSDSGSEYSYSGPDSEEDDGFEEPDNFSTAKAYIMQYTDYTHKTIEKLINNKNSTVKAKPHCSKVDDILSELQNEKPVITHNIELSSDEENALNESGLTKSHEKIKPDQVVDLNTTDETHNEIHVTAPTQSSVILVENTETEVITLDSSAILSDENDCQKVPLETTNVNYSDLKPQISLKTELFNISETNLLSDSDSSEEDFEEVSMLVSPKKSEPVVELVLNVGEAPQDDIFADIFTETVKDQNILPNVFEHKNIKVEHDDEDEFNHENFNTAIDEHSILEEKQEGRIDFLPNQQAKEKVVSSISTESQGSTKSNVEAEFNQNNINAPVNTSQNPNESGSNVSVKSSKDVSSHIPDEKQLNSVVSLTEIPKKIIPEEHIDSVEATKETPKRVISEEQLNCMVEQIQTEEQDLLQEKRRFDRIGRNITEQMTKEAQELLQIFGIPYIVAPMEAEAQCAFLENIKLTDGTITDDSDVWLFGGSTVYKNFFNQKKHVLQFLSERIERSFNLNREQLILLALLVGSDYTTGVTGVGPVTALEILASFPFNKKQVSNETTKQGRSAHIVSGLQEFKKWVRSGKRTDDTNLKKKLRNVKITDDFPSVRVVQAYLDPNVEKNEDKFTWGELDLTVLRDFTKSKFGWSQNKLDEIMKPVLKRIQDRTSQRTLQDYFKRKLDFHSLEDQMSKRVKAAVQKMGPDDDKKNPEHVFLEPEKPKAAKRKKSKATEGESSKNNKELAQKKQKKAVVNDELASMLVKVKSHAEPDNVRSDIAIKIPKSDRFQEIIPQREKDKQCLLQNKMKAIEVFRKTTIDRKKQTRKRRPNLPKDKADLSESDSD